MATLADSPVISRHRLTLVTVVAVLALVGAAGLTAVVHNASPLVRTATGIGTDGVRAIGAVRPVPSGDWLASVRDDGPRSTIEIARLSTGERLATLDAGFSVMAVVRQSRGEILISDVVADTPTGAGSPHPRLWLLDSRTLAVKAGPIPMPQRAMYTLYAPGIVLSGDERYVFYLRHVECGPGCDDYAVVVMDLDARAEVAAGQLPRNCGFAELLKTEGAGVTAMCPEFASVWRVDERGRTVEVARFDVGGDWPIHSGLTSKGEAFAVTQRGRLIVKDPSGGVAIDRPLLAAPQRFTGLHRLNISNTHDALGVKISADEGLTAILILNRENWSYRQVELPIGTTRLAVAGSQLIVAAGAGQVVLADTIGGGIRSMPASTGGPWRWSFAWGTN